MEFKLTPYGLDALRRGLVQAPEVARRELLVGMREATLLLESDVVAQYPKHTGMTRASITSDAFATPVGVLGLVGSANPIAAFIDLGTKPHTPPLEPLLDWVAGVLGLVGPEGMRAARGIQQKISRQGTKAKPQFEPALRRNRAALVDIFERAAGRVAAALDGGKA